MSWYLRIIKQAISHVIMIAACMQQALPGLAVGKHTSTNFKSPWPKGWRAFFIGSAITQDVVSKVILIFK
jgi:hypothetical protein